MEDTIHARPNRPLGIRCEFLGRRAGWKRGLRMHSRRYSRNAQPGPVESALVWFQGRKTYSTPELPRGRSIFCEELEHDEPHCVFKLGASPRLQHAFDREPLLESRHQRTRPGMEYARFMGRREANLDCVRVRIPRVNAG